MIAVVAILKRFLEKLAKENQEQFKGQAPDCCTINRPGNKAAGCKENREEG